MKLSKLYTNKPSYFEPILFVDGLNVVLAEIRLPETKEKDTHNLGKTTIGRLIDFCLLSEPDNNFFMLKHLEQFKDFIFFLELELLDGTYVTIRRSIESYKKISFKKHPTPYQDYSFTSDQEWDHVDTSVTKAKELLDAFLDLRSIKSWPYRKILGYLLRSQEDYRDVYQLRKFLGKHVDWKPFLAHVLGFNASIIHEHYQKEAELEKKQSVSKTILNELGGISDDINNIDGLLLLKQNDIAIKTKLLDAFDFRQQDKDLTEQLVNDVDIKISKLNTERYALNQSRKKINNALKEEQIAFNPDEAEQLFKESGVLFQGQIKKDFQQLIAFNKAITEERGIYLNEERKEIDARLKQVNAELTTLGQKRAETLSFLSNTDVFNKYKQISDELVTLKADIKSLASQREHLHRLQELRTEIRNLSEAKTHLQTQIEVDVEKQKTESTSLFSAICLYFNEIIERVVSRKALLTVGVNKEGHLDFKAVILDGSGNATSADLGTTYKKLLCIAFDMAIVRAYLDSSFPRFVFHDGIFETLDDRKKENLLQVMREYADLGVQQVITLIDSDLPKKSDEDEELFDDSDIVLMLHDEDETGRLFKMASW